MKLTAAIFLALCTFTSAQAAGEGRSLPTGEEAPLFVKQLYTSPQGEVHFLESDSTREQSALLRIPSGLLAELKEVHGHSGCKSWVASSKDQNIPAGCELLFRDDSEGTYFHVQSDEMAEASLFHVVSRVTREANVSL